MADCIEFDLTALRDFFDFGPDFRLGGLHGLRAQVTVSPAILIALLAGDPSRIDRIVGPADSGPAEVTTESDLNPVSHL